MRRRVSAGDPWIGQVISGRYRLVARLAEGGMGRIYIAEHIELDTRIAIKILPATDAPPSRVERFRREARAVSRLRSPHVARAFDFGELPDGSFFFAMELLVGEDLSSLLARERKLPAPRAIAMLRQIANALDAAHALGFVHRDLKPENIFIVADIVYDELVKVLDFGIAKEFLRNTASLTAAGALLGTPGYMAPEQVQKGGSISPRTDVYSLAAVAFEMLTGELPHPEAGLFEMLEALVSEPARTPSEVGVCVDGLDEVMLKALARDPMVRHASAGELVDDLERVLLRTSRSDPRALAPVRRSDPPERSWPGEPIVIAPPTLKFATPSRLDMEEVLPPSLSSNQRWLVATAVLVALSVGFALGAIVA